LFHVFDIVGDASTIKTTHCSNQGQCLIIERETILSYYNPMFKDYND